MCVSEPLGEENFARAINPPEANVKGTFTLSPFRLRRLIISLYDKYKKIQVFFEKVLKKTDPSVTPCGACLEVPVCGARHFHRTMTGARNCRPQESLLALPVCPPGAVGLGSHFQGRLLLIL